jgi:hypothetical protein
LDALAGDYGQGPRVYISFYGYVAYNGGWISIWSLDGMKLTREELRLIIREVSFTNVASAMGSVVDAGHSGMKTYNKLAGGVAAVKAMTSAFDSVASSQMAQSASANISSNVDSAFASLTNAGDNPPVDISEEDEEELDEEELVEAKLRFIIREILRGAR